MRAHDHEHDGPEVPRPKTARPHAPDAATAARAAVAGRWDALSASGILALQRAAGNRGVAAALQDQDRTVVREVAGSGGGPPLRAGVRADMKARLGHDFGDVRVHHDTRAEESATAVNARACTAGPDIVFQRDRYDLSSGEGRATLAHELAYVVQQRSATGAASPSRVAPAS